MLILEFGIAFFCFIDILIAPEAAVRWLPRYAWLLPILIFPVAGSIAWIVAGRPWRAALHRPRDLSRLGMDEPASPASGVAEEIERRAAQPDHPLGDTEFRTDAELAAELCRLNQEHEQTLRRWEADLRRREEQLRQRAGGSEAAA